MFKNNRYIWLRKMKTIIVTGTPCTGKTTISKKISDKFISRYFDVNRIIKKYNV